MLPPVIDTLLAACVAMLPKSSSDNVVNSHTAAPTAADKHR
jgi:hypothetical protein